MARDRIANKSEEQNKKKTLRNHSTEIFMTRPRSCGLTICYNHRTVFYFSRSSIIILMISVTRQNTSHVARRSLSLLNALRRLCVFVHCKWIFGRTLALLLLSMQCHRVHISHTNRNSDGKKRPEKTMDMHICFIYISFSFELRFLDFVCLNFVSVFFAFTLKCWIL